MYEPEEEPSFLSRYTVPLGVAIGLIVMGVIAFFAIGLAWRRRRRWRRRQRQQRRERHAGGLRDALGR